MGVSFDGKAVVSSSEGRVAALSHGLCSPDAEPRLALARLGVLEVIRPAGEATRLQDKRGMNSVYRLDYSTQGGKYAARRALDVRIIYLIYGTPCCFQTRAHLIAWHCLQIEVSWEYPTLTDAARHRRLQLACSIL